MTLFIQPDHIQQIKTEAEQAYPEECCGLLLGTIKIIKDNSRETERTVAEVWPVANAWGNDAQSKMAELRDSEAEHSFTTRRRYWIDPKDMLAAQKYARTKHLQIIGIYHSHPDHPAVPSECDRTCAWSGYSYIIVSVPNGQATDVLSWTLDNHHQFQSEWLVS